MRMNMNGGCGGLRNKEINETPFVLFSLLIPAMTTKAAPDAGQMLPVGNRFDVVQNGNG